jgi:hypothetical protein
MYLCNLEAGAGVQFGSTRDVEMLVRFTALLGHVRGAVPSRSLMLILDQNAVYTDQLRAGRPRDRTSSPGRGKNFNFSISSRPAAGSTQLSILWVPGVKRQGHEADHSHPISAEVKKTWIHTSTPPIRLHGVVLIADRGRRVVSATDP